MDPRKVRFDLRSKDIASFNNELMFRPETEENSE